MINTTDDVLKGVIKTHNEVWQWNNQPTLQNTKPPQIDLPCKDIDEILDAWNEAPVELVDDTVGAQFRLNSYRY